MTPRVQTTETSRTIGIDIGGTKILGVLLDARRSTILERRQIPTPRHDPAALVGAVEAIVGDLQSAASGAGGSVAAIGVGVPGLVDNDGVLRYGPNVPGVLDLDLGRALRDRFGLPTVAENDGANAAVAEHRLGAARGSDHAIIITQGTGIGGGLIVNGRLLRGANGFAGEPGHMLVDADGPTCACGQRGCWEAVASGGGLANLARMAIDAGHGARLLELAGGNPANVRGEHVTRASDEGDTHADEVIRVFAFWVAQGLGSLITLLDPEVVVLGGGLIAISERFLDDVRSQVMQRVMGGRHRPAVPIVAAELGTEAGAIGGALVAWDLVAPKSASQT